MAHVNMEVPWLEGEEGDFKELREGLAKLKKGEILNKEDSESSSENEDEGITEERIAEDFKLIRRSPEESESDDDGEDEDPGDDNPKMRFLWAAQYDKLELVKSLLESSPSLLTFKDGDGYTALHRASYNNHIQIVRFLLDQGCDPLVTTHEGWTPLHSAAKWDSKECVELLLQVTPPNIQTNGGQTPLHLAAMSSTGIATLQLLLYHPEIDPDLINSQGDTPRDLAIRNGPYTHLFDAVMPRAVRSHREK